jgi:hypothetical protein
MGISGKSSFGGGDLGLAPKRVKKNEALFLAEAENSQKPKYFRRLGAWFQS